MKANEYKNKLFSVLGDSISTLDGFSMPEDMAYYDADKKVKAKIFAPEDTWWGEVVDALGGKVLVNNSISGSTVTYSPNYEFPYYGCSDQRTSSLHEGSSPDVIIVYLGTNDWGAGVRIESDKNVVGYEETLRVFSVAYKTMLKKLRNNYKNAEIWCVTLATSLCSAKPSFEFPYVQMGWHISKFCEAIKNCAKECDCKIIDLYKNAEPYDTIDGFHPNREGMKTIANAVLKCVKEFN